MPSSLPGRAKSGGRVAGTPNKRTASRQQELLSRLEMLELELDLKPGSLHPVEGLARIAADPKTPLDIKVDCLKSIAPFVVPKLATVTVKGDEENPVVVEHVNIDRFLLDPTLVAAAQRVALAMEEDYEVSVVEVAKVPRLVEVSAEPVDQEKR